ncbi:MAG: NADH-quinone oxidoreductase subunit C [Opitutales bacterium]
MDLEKIKNVMPSLEQVESFDNILSFACPKEDLRKYATLLKEELGFETLSTLVSVDDDSDNDLFSVVYVFLSHQRKQYLKFRVSGNSTFPTISDIYKYAIWQEREAYDMMGIVFQGHCDLRRILMWDSYPWHPLRKSFPLAGRDAPLPDTFEGNEDATEVVPAPMADGPFYSESGKVFTKDKESRAHPKK